MSKLSQTCFFLVLVLGWVLRSHLTFATTQLGWADEFATSTIQCANSACQGSYRYNGGNSDGPNQWTYVGTQGSDSAGRANAREESNFFFRDDSTTSCNAETVTIARYRNASPPNEGNACSTGTVTYVGSTSLTVDSCGPLSDTFNYTADAPVFNFSAETATGTTIGYRSITTYSNSLGAGGSITNCFRIQWL